MVVMYKLSREIIVISSQVVPEIEALIFMFCWFIYIVLLYTVYINFDFTGNKTQ